MNTVNVGNAGAEKEVHLTLLLIIGARHPFNLDEKYLVKRKINVEDMDPLNLRIQQLRELIHTEWRDDFEPRPHTPTLIRLIYMGMVLEDDKLLKDLRLSNDSPNIIHLSVKPELKLEDEVGAAKSASRRGSDDEEPRTAGCCARCTIL